MYIHIFSAATFDTVNTMSLLLPPMLLLSIYNIIIITYRRRHGQKERQTTKFGNGRQYAFERSGIGSPRIERAEDTYLLVNAKT